MQILPPLTGCGTDRRYRGAVPRPASRSLVGAAPRPAVRTLVVACAVGLSLGVLAAPAAAATCTYDAVTRAATVTVGNGESATIARAGPAITLDGVPCDAATVDTTDTIAVTATGIPTQITIDLSGGPFEPGATAETDASSEIEFTLDLPTGTPTVRIAGATTADVIVIGNDGVNLNAAEANGDADVLITGSPTIVIAGGDGDDRLSVAGESGTGAAGRTATVLGDAGADLLLGATGGSSFDGGAGVDTLDYGAAASLTLADLGGGRVDHQGGGTDAVTAIENLIGSPGDDRIVGDGGANELSGTAGEDRLVGGGGDDTLDGGDGADTASYRRAGDAVAVDLGKGTAEGDGNDTLIDIENVDGSKSGDELHGDGSKNSLDGRGGHDQIFGHNGGDFVLGRVGDDLLFGQNGSDVLRAGKGRDQLDGGAGNDVCKGGDDPDSHVFCENFPTVRLPAGVWFHERA
jgi:Ca2+-binding RTX toxin-like protein